ncbi:MAG TPA: DUF58 domain-containing protein [Opitutaceae bacterium]|jgi:uncharacterized protein (DUF58 family)
MSLVPRPRLLWIVLDVALVGVLGAVFAPAHAAWLVALAGIGAVALADAALALARNDRVQVALPRVARFSRDRESSLEVTLGVKAGAARRVRLGLVLPGAFAAREDEATVDLPGGAERYRLEWKCTPRQRGRFEGVVACTETPSSLGLWSVRRRAFVPCQLRVHPNLLADRKESAAVFITGRRDGARQQRTLGRGREFDNLREYLPGDGLDEIHWKATAKRNRAITKTFQVERTQEIYVVVDASRLSARPVTQGGIEQPALERYITSALLLLAAAQHQGDRFGLATFDHRVRTFVRSLGGARHFASCRDALLDLKASESTPDIAEIIRYLRVQIRRRALIFFLADMTDPVLADSFTRNIRVLSRQHLVVLCQTRPAEVAPLYSGPELRDAGQVYHRLAGHARWAETRSLAQRLRPHGVGSILIDDATMATQIIRRYLEIKRRQAL